MKRRALRGWQLAWLLIGLTVAATTQAGTACEQRTLQPAALAAAAETAMRTVQALDAEEAPLAVVARVGTDLWKQGLVYSHAGFVVRDHADGRWTVVHLLNQCGTHRSTLYAQGLIDFFADDLVNQDARIVWLRPALAQPLAERLRRLPEQSMHEPRYSLIARPGSAHYQNSTAWVLEMIASVAHANDGDRRTAYAFARRDGFMPDVIQIAYTKRILGGLFSANTVFTDHPVGTRLSGAYPVVTVRSIVRYLDRAGYAVVQREWRNGALQVTPGPLSGMDQPADSRLAAGGADAGGRSQRKPPHVRCRRLPRF